ncbi:helix-turn-helix domain-containing protein [Marinobacter nauticus]|uniref:HTH cro/C1-type domain-containing protein n=1 Tax=Marinobacter nauticus TaxID=2743 RepID=A0A833JQJ5_MARNT|nr:helix-turn-helix transcriptional regulator [Marinobacter nauticus]KAE8546177.1 hypothetical protein F6453_1423 [Marinobacter nauticus]
MADHRDFAQRLKLACDRSPNVPEYGKGQQTWFKDRMGVSQEAVRRWFEGESRPRPKLMAQLAKLLDVDEAWLALGTSTDMSDKERRQYKERVDAACYMVFGIFMAAGYSCAFADEPGDVDFYAIRGGKQTAVSVTTAWPKSKNVFVAPVRNEYQNKLNLCVVPVDTGVFETLVMDQDGIREYGEAKTDNILITVKREKQGYHTEGRVWTQLKDTNIL